MWFLVLCLADSSNSSLIDYWMTLIDQRQLTGTLRHLLTCWFPLCGSQLNGEDITFTTVIA
jgi:hypothetical protein